MDPWGLSGRPIPADLPFAGVFTDVCRAQNVSPPLVYAIGWRESIREYGANALRAVSDDGGHGIMQLTSTYPADWANPYSNVRWAIEGDGLIRAALDLWHGRGYIDGDLVRLVAGSYNEGIGGAEAAHAAGDVDAGTTDHYAAYVLATYTALVAGTPLPD